MPFTSLAFIVFAAATLAACCAAPQRARWMPLLGASAAFYVLAAGASGAGLVAGLVALTYLLAIAVARCRGRAARRALVLAGASCLTAALAGWRWLAADGPGAASVAVPFGLSFLSLRLLGYLLDVHRGAVAAERHPGMFALFALVFPELPAGPIERAGHLLPQLRLPAPFTYSTFTTGVRRIAWGLFKKLVIADRLRAVVASAYDAPQGADGAAYAVATVLFAFQIYCDFSGYSDVAVGLGETFGLRLSRNFDRPYLATSITAFWGRWHISFSTWLRDYLFLPVAYPAQRALDRWLASPVLRDRLAYAAGVVPTMAACGLWHGARWTYLAWAMAMAGLLMASVATRTLRARVTATVFGGRFARTRRAWRTLATFTLVTLTWVFFRAASVADALRILRAIPAGVGSASWRIAAGLTGRAPLDTDLVTTLRLGQTSFEAIIVLSALLALVVVEAVGPRVGIRGGTLTWPRWLRWPAYVALVVFIVLFRAPSGAGFIYQGF